MIFFHSSLFLIFVKQSKKITKENYNYLLYITFVQEFHYEKQKKTT